MTRNKQRASLRYRATTLLLVSMACLPAAAQSEVALTPHEASYKVSISVVNGRLDTRLAATENGYVATHVIAPTGMSRLIARGSIAETSEFIHGQAGIVPVGYQSNDSLSRDKSRTDIRFDWDKGEASGTINGAAVKIPLDEFSHDRISIQYQLMHDLLNATPNTRYRLFDFDELKTLEVRNVGTRRVVVPAGEFEAVGIQHQAENSSRVTTLWCVAELDYLPAIIEQHRKGKLRVRAELESYSPTPPQAHSGSE